MKWVLKDTETDLQIKDNQVEPRGEQCTRAASVRGRTLRQMPATQGNSAVCEPISRADGESGEIRILYQYFMVFLTITSHVVFSITCNWTQRHRAAMPSKFNKSNAY